MMITKRIGSFALAIALVFSLVVPVFGNKPFLAPVVQAAEPEDETSKTTNTTGDTSQPSGDETAIVNITFAAENCTIVDSAGIPLGEAISVAAGTEVIFGVNPNDGCVITSVMANATSCEADPVDGMYHIVADSDIYIQASCSAVQLPVFSVTVLPEGAAQTKYFHIELASENTQITTKAYSLSEYAAAGELEQAMIEGTAFALTDSTPITADGTYFVYIIDDQGVMSKQAVIVTGIDTVAPQILSVERASEDWATSIQYSILLDDSLDVVSVRYALDTASAALISPDSEGNYHFTAAQNGTYTVTVQDAAGNSSSVQILEEKIDITDPLISELERVTEGWSETASYQFRVLETESGISSVKLTTGGAVQLLEPQSEGVYSFTLTANETARIEVLDAAGNDCVQEITEAQIDREGPTFVDFKRSESGWSTSATYTFRLTDDAAGVRTVTLTIGDSEPTEITADSSGTYSFTLTENIDFTLSASDVLGKITEKIESESQIDTESPVITSVFRENDEWAVSADYVISATDGISGISLVTVTAPDGNEIQAVLNSDGTYRFTAAANGIYTVTVKDGAGNPAVTHFEESKVDQMAPEITDISRASGTWSQNAYYTFRVEDSGAGIDTVHVTLNGSEISLEKQEDGSYRFLAILNGNYSIHVADKLGNAKSVVLSEDHIDQTPPVITSVTPQSEWDASLNSIVIKAKDESELARVTVTDKSGKGYAVTTTAAETFQAIVDHNGEYIVTAFDTAGNSISETFVVNRIDSEAPSAPTLTSSANGNWVNSDITLTAAATDTQSGIAAYWYSSSTDTFDEELWTKVSVTGSNPGEIIITEEADTDFYVIAEDAVGNKSSASVIHVSIDKTAPEDLTVVYLEDTEQGYVKTVNDIYVYSDQMSFFAKAEDPASGVVAYEYQIVGQNGASDWISVTADEAGFTQKYEGADVLGSVYIRAIDKAGNRSEPFTLQKDNHLIRFALENTPEKDSERAPAPELEVTIGNETYNGSWTAKDVSIVVSGSEAVSGIAKYQWRIEPADPSEAGTDWEDVPVVDGIAQLIVSADTNGTYQFRAITHAGNPSQVETSIVKVRKTLPATAQVIPEAATGTNNWHTKLPTYSIQLPTIAQYTPEVTYIISWTHNGVSKEDIVYDGANAPNITADGIWTVAVTSVDEAGNRKTPAATVIQVDTVAPVSPKVLLGEEDITNIRAVAGTAYDRVVISDLTVFSDFEIFRQGPVRIQAEMNDDCSGVAGIYYQVVPENGQFSKTGIWTTLDTEGLVLKADRKCRLFFKAVDAAGNITYFTGKNLILDAQAPVGAGGGDLTILPLNTNLSEHGFYYGDVSVSLHIEEPVVETVFSGLKQVTYRVLADGIVTQEGQLYPGTGEEKKEENRVISWDGGVVISAQNNDSNHVVLEITAVDQAGNIRTTSTADGQIKIDVTEPVASARYDSNTPANTHNSVSYYTGSRTMTLSVTELNFLAEQSFIYVTNKDTGTLSAYEWVAQGDGHAAIIPITEDGHYSVAVSITDAAGNKTEALIFDEGTDAGSFFVLDNTAPEMTVAYDNNLASNEIYFDAPRTATITVTERNFDPEAVDAEILVTDANGIAKTLVVSNWISNGNTHTAYVEMASDGVYSVNITCTDIPGNEAKPTSYIGIAAQNWILDQTIDAPQISGVEHNTPYAEEVVPVVDFTDENFDFFGFKLYRTRLNEIGVDITSEVKDSVTVEDIDDGKRVTFDIFDKVRDNDGIYTLEVFQTDKAGNTATAQVTFSVNRFGSVYVYSEYLLSIMGGSFQKINTDVVIVEINPTRVVAGSAVIQITRDGTPIADPIYSIEPVANGKETPGSSGWYEYQYTISADNFEKDGVYTIVVSTVDSAGNVPENTGEATAIRFSVDTTAPELLSVIGLENSIVKADSLEVDFTASDNVSLHRIQVYVDEQLIQEWNDLDGYSFTGSFIIPAGLERHVRIVIEDKAGNILDTDSEGFAPGYSWQDVTVSTNPLLRFYANKPLFYSSLAAVVLGVAAVCFFIISKKRKNKQDV